MKPRSIIGIDISTDEVRAACVKTTNSGPVLEGATSVPLPANSIDRDGVLNPDVLGEAVRTVCASLGAKTVQAAIGVTGGNLVARVMEIPPVPSAEIRAVLRGEMDHYRILPAGQSAFDFFRLPDPPERIPDPSEATPLRVLLMGVEERLVASYRAVADTAGLDVLTVEPGSVAILRSLYPVLHEEEAVATVILSSTATDICITHNGDLQFYRRVDTGITDMQVRALATVEERPTPMAAGGFLVTADEVDDPDTYVASDGEAYNRQAASVLMTEVQRSIDYYVREFPAAGERMLVRFAIDTPDPASLFEVLEQYLRRDAKLASPFDGILSIGPECYGIVGGATDLRFTTAIGLALRGAGGAYAGAPQLDLSQGDRVIRERRAAPRAFVFSLAGAGAVLMCTVLAALLVGFRTSSATRVLAQTDHELTALIEEHSLRVAKLDRQRKLVQAIHNRDKPLRQTIEFVSASIPGTATLQTLNIDPTGTIRVAGSTTSPRIVADIMDTVNKSPALEPVRLQALIQRDRTRGRKVLEFDLQTAYLKADAPAPAPARTVLASTTASGGK